MNTTAVWCQILSAHGLEPDSLTIVVPIITPKVLDVVNVIVSVVFDVATSRSCCVCGAPCAYHQKSMVHPVEGKATDGEMFENLTYAFAVRVRLMRAMGTKRPTLLVVLI